MLFKLLFFSLQTNKVEKTKSYIRSGISKAISGRCNCEFPVAFIRSGIFQCWNVPDEITYSVQEKTGYFTLHEVAINCMCVPLYLLKGCAIASQCRGYRVTV